MFKKYLLASVAFSPADQPGGAGDETPDNERIELDPADDETVEDPVDEGEPGDEGDAADDIAGDDESDADEVVEQASGGAAARPSRGERRIQALNERTRHLADENARITRQLEEVRRNPPAPIETPTQRAERLALMSPEERAQEYVTTALAAHEQKNNALVAQLMDQSDKVAFDTQTTVNPLFKKLASEVERRLVVLRSRGDNLPRHVVATYIIGERAVAQAGKGVPKARERQRQQQTRPGNARGDVAPNRQERRDGGVAAMEKRLENVQI